MTGAEDEAEEVAPEPLCWGGQVRKNGSDTCRHSVHSDGHLPCSWDSVSFA